jgi:hypothetical protein
MFSAMNGYAVFTEFAVVYFDGYGHNGTSIDWLVAWLILRD